MDIFYSSNNGSGWTAPILVNNYGASDSGFDEMPKLAVDSSGAPHCVWSSGSSYAGSGTDRDIFYSKKSGATWAGAEMVNDAVADNAAAPNNDDYMPTLAIRANGSIVVAWISSYANPSGGPFGGIGADSDPLFAIRTASGWTPAAPLTNFFASDTGADIGPVPLCVDADGDTIAAWCTDDPLRPLNGLGTDLDIVYSILPAAGAWSEPLEACALARSDTGIDSFPSVAATGSGANGLLFIVWMSTEDLAGAGTDWDILGTVIGGPSLFPPINAAYLVNSAAAVDGAASDRMPSLCVEPGGVLHCIWQSNYNLGGTVGADMDIFHSLNATNGGEWSGMELLGLNGLFDLPAADDIMPSMLATDNGLLSAVWESMDDYGGTYGTDADIFHALGLAKLFSRPAPINTSAQFDNPAVGFDFDRSPRFAVDPQGVLHAVWESQYAGLAGGLAGADGDIYHATFSPAGWSAPQLVNSNGASDAGLDSMPDIAIDQNGNICVVWASEENIGGTLGTDFDILYSVNGGAGWSFPAPLNSYAATDTKHDTNPRIAVSADGKAHCVWVGEYDFGAGTSNIRYSVLGAAGWSAAEQVHPAFAVPPQGMNAGAEIAIAASGVPHVIWWSNVNHNGAGADFDIFHSLRSGSAWAATKFVNDAANDSADDWDVSIARGPDGTMRAVWSADLNIQGAGVDRDLFYSRLASGVWSAPQLLCDLGKSDTGSDQAPCIAYDAEGALHAAWRSEQNLLRSGNDWDIFYMRLPAGSGMPSTEPIFLANVSAFADGAAFDSAPCMALDQNGRVHIGWDSDATLGNSIGADSDVLHAWADPIGKAAKGAPRLVSASDALNGDVRLAWANYAKPPAQHLGFAWDIYTGTWVLGGWNNTLWHPFPLGSFLGDIPLIHSGGYHVWISNQYADGAWYPCANPWTGLIYSGKPHTALNMTAAQIGANQVRVQWKPEIYGTWHWQIIAWRDGAGWVNTTGPSGNSLWQFIFYPTAGFLNGQIDLTVPSAGTYTFFMRAAGWLPPHPTGDYATATAPVS
ncbi:MAG: hypothetical protein BWZ10_01021 [candidate division BRC1 bacterium ADurb.BinA364]|nr:MAG: hypothetical protein BWZ10_01021 [candidate division BRC1 bacterium ADurb.BinA364]